MNKIFQNGLSLFVLFVGLAMMSLGPYGGCSCKNPVDTTTGPTPTFTPDHGPVVDDFNDGNTITNWGSGIVVGANAPFIPGPITGCSFPPAPPPAPTTNCIAPCPQYDSNIGITFNVDPTNPSNSGGMSLQITGTLGSQSGPPWPYAQVALGLDGPISPQAVGYAHPTEPKLSFWIKLNTVTGVKVSLIDTVVTCGGGAFGRDLTAGIADIGSFTAGVWTKFVIKFPTDTAPAGNPLYPPNNGNNFFAQPTWVSPNCDGGCGTFTQWYTDNSNGSLMSVMFQPLGGGAPTPFDFEIDDVRFE